MNERSVEICATCAHDKPGYVSVIGTCAHCCEKHWTCKPGKDAKLYQPKEKEGNRREND